MQRPGSLGARRRGSTTGRRLDVTRRSPSSSFSPSSRRPGQRRRTQPPGELGCERELGEFGARAPAARCRQLNGTRASSSTPANAAPAMFTSAAHRWPLNRLQHRGWQKASIQRTAGADVLRQGHCGCCAVGRPDAHVYLKNENVLRMSHVVDAQGAHSLYRVRESRPRSASA